MWDQNEWQSKREDPSVDYSGHNGSERGRLLGLLLATAAGTSVAILCALAALAAPALADVCETTPYDWSCPGPPTPVNQVPPVITQPSDRTQVGDTLVVSNGTWTQLADPTYRYQWSRCDAQGAGCTTIVGATTNRYTATTADSGRTLRATVTVTNKKGPYGTSLAASSGPSTQAAEYKYASASATSAPSRVVVYALPATDPKEGIDDPVGPARVTDADTGECFSDPEGELTYCGQNDAPDADSTPGALSATAIRTPAWGLSDNKAAIWLEPRTTALSVTLARLTVPYDVILRQAQDPGYFKNVADWIAGAQRAGKRVLVSFERCRALPECNGYLPMAKDDGNSATFDYPEAVRAFLDRYPYVRDYTSWNEPNNPFQPTRNNPFRAGKFHRVLAGLCASRTPKCNVAAGDFLDRPDLMTTSQPDFLRRYRNGMGGPPQQWAIHLYRDTKYNRTTEINDFLRRTSYTTATRPPARIWLTEQGAYRNQYASDPPRIVSFSAAEQNEDMRWSLNSLACGRSDRIVRYYYYSLVGQSTTRLAAPDPPRDVFDTGLLNDTSTGAFGATRDVYSLYQNKISAGCS